MFGPSGAYLPRCSTGNRSSPVATSKTLAVLTSNQAHRSHDQLSRILDVLGTPTIDEFHAITSAKSKEYIRTLPYAQTSLSVYALTPASANDARTNRCTPTPILSPSIF